MQIFRGIEAIRPPPTGVVLVMGNFDGVHLGHQALIGLCRERATAIGAQAWGLTFDPHPSKVLAPELAPPLISSLERRVELMGEGGLDAVLVVNFTRALAAVDPEAFVDGWLVRAGAREVVVGYDFSFGKGRAGTPDTLRELCAARGIAVHVVPPVTIPTGLVPSSSKIREFVLEGRMDAAACLLGRLFEVEGRVVPGAGRGATIGFPTANVEPEGELLPKSGVYATFVRIQGEGIARPGAANVGTNPTFSDVGGIRVEVHILGWEGGLLKGRKLRLAFVERLRDELRFPSVEALTAQIAEDVVRAREILAGRSGGPERDFPAETKT